MLYFPEELSIANAPLEVIEGSHQFEALPIDVSVLVLCAACLVMPSSP